MSGDGSPSDFKDCVSKEELNKALQDHTRLLTDIRTSIANLVTRVNDLELRQPPQDDDHSHDDDDDDTNNGDQEDGEVFVGQDARAEQRPRAEQLRRDQQQRRQGNGSNNVNRNGRDDPYSKIKFSMPPFDGAYDADAYLNWEMTVDQKYSSHMVPEMHRVRLATCEFTNYAIIWWNGLVSSGLEPESWPRLKRAMRNRFIPPDYTRELKKKLQRLNQGSKSVHDYYQELQIAMLRCSIQEDDEDTMIRFYSGLRREIQDLVDYKDYNTTNRLFHFAILAEKELQGRQQVQKLRNNFGSTSTSRVPPGQATTFPSTSTRSAAPSSNTRARSAGAPQPSREVSKSTVSQDPMPRSSSGAATTGRTTGIVCRRCQGIGHVMKDCPSQRAYSATADGGYVSHSDVEEEYAFEANLAADHDMDSEGEEISGTAATESYAARTFIVKRVLSSQMGQAEQLQRHNLFQTFLIVKDARVRTIIDGGSCNNLLSSDLVKNLSLPTRAHPHPYYIQWFNNSGKVKVTQSARVHFSIGSYHDYADFDVVPMQACSLLLGRPWEFDTDATHHGRSNKYSLMHKGKKISLLPLTPAEIVQCDKALAEKEKKERVLESENQQVAQSVFPPKKEKNTPRSEGIKLKGGVMLATKTDLAEIQDNNTLCYAFVCKEVLFSIDDIPSSLPAAVTNLLQEYKDVFPAEIPPGLPPLRGIEHQIDLIPGATLPNRAAYRTNPEETKEIQR